MRTKTLALLVTPIFLFALSACDSPQKDVAEAQKEVVKEQREANKQIGEAQKDLAEEKKEAMDKPMTPPAR